MAKVFENGHVVITYEEALVNLHWVELSQYLSEKYTDNDFADTQQTEIILKDAFQFLVDKFRNLVHQETQFSFFWYIFKLHEESVELYFNTLDGYVITQITEQEFALYRRILKLVLEEGCDINMEWGNLSLEESTRAEEVLEHLIYIGTWMYDLSDAIAYTKMINDCYTVDIKNGLFGTTWNHHFEWTYNGIKKIMNGQYKAAICDENAAQQLVDKLQEVYGFHTSDFFRLIREIQLLHNPIDPNAQTIEPYILPENLATIFNKPLDLMQSFCNGLTVDRMNKPSIETAIYKPTDENRYAFRPILVYNIDGIQRALIGENKINETFQVLTTNALHWEGLPHEWFDNSEIKIFMNQKGLEHESIYLDKIKELIQNVNLYADYNIEYLLKKDNQNISILKDPGEIDCIIIIPEFRRIIISDVKYNRARYEAVGWQKDFPRFSKEYEKKLKKKTDWIRDHRKELQEHFEVKYKMNEISLIEYSVEGCFFINSPTFYMFNGNYRAITMKELPDFLDGWLGYTIVNGNNRNEKVNHPYFSLAI